MNQIAVKPEGFADTLIEYIFPLEELFHFISHLSSGPTQQITFHYWYFCYAEGSRRVQFIHGSDYLAQLD